MHYPFWPAALRLAGISALIAMVFAALAMTSPQARADEFNKKYDAIDTNYEIPQNNVAWISPDGNDQTGNGSESAPYRSFKKALSTLSPGGTVVAKSGIYREPHFFVDKANITFQAAPHAKVWLKGSRVVTDWTADGNIWRSTGDYQNFCHVCTTNTNPAVEGMAAYPEQVFINDEPLEQVATLAEVTAGKFYVEDKTPTTMKVPDSNRQGYNIGAQDQITYYLGSNPTVGTTEISERTRAFTTTLDAHGFALKGINIAQYSPIQVWGFDDPQVHDMSGPITVSINGSGSLVQDVIVTQSSNDGLFLDPAESSVVRNSRFIDNGGNGMSANRSHHAVLEQNIFSGNNAAGFETKGSLCTAFCTRAEIKVTHAEDFTFRNNVVDESQSGHQNSLPDRAKQYTLPGFWCDEGCIDAKIVNNYFSNVQSGIFYEVSDNGIIASNIIEGAGTGITIAGSSNTKVYNNTISRTFHPLKIREDNRVNGCNSFNARTKICLVNEPWSQSKGLSWNTTGLEIYNNIISSRASVPKDNEGPYWAYPVRTEGTMNQDGTPIYTNDMFKGLDYNAYYRNDPATELYVLTWDLAEQQHPLNILFTSPAQIAADSRVNQSIDGLERHALDLSGSRADNPFFVKEATGNTDYNQSDYAIKPDSPAAGSGKPLPVEIAQAIDPSGELVKPGVAVDRGALRNVRMNATDNSSMR